MKTFIKLFLIFLFSTVLHWAFASLGAEAGIGVNFILVFAFCACVETPTFFGYMFAFLAGLFLDSFGTQMFGVYALSFTAAAWLTYFLAKYMDFRNFLTQIAVCAGISVFAECFYSLAGIIFIKGVAWAGLKTLILGSVINGCLAPFMFMLLNAAKIRKSVS